MSKLFASTPFSQSTYSPLRSSQDAGPDDDDPEAISSHHHGHSSTPLTSTTTTTTTTITSNSVGNINRRLYNTPQQRRPIRHRSQSMSSNRSLSDHPHQQLGSTLYPSAFAEGEDSSEDDLPAPSSQQQQQQQQHRFSSTSINTLGGSGNNGSAGGHRGSIVSLVGHGPADRSSWRSGGAVRTHQSLIHATSVVVVDGSSNSAMDEPDSPPPKYTAEDLEYSEPARMPFGRDEELGLAYHRSDDGQGDGLLMQASTTLVIAVSGLICAGWLLDVIQHWQVFVDISELIILIPILLNLKGNLEMNLASRLSTAANMGLLDQRSSRNAFIKGNLALLQVQSLTVGSVAGLFSFGLGAVVHPQTNNVNEIALMITASMLCAAMSSFVLGGFMCGLVLVCRKYHINPDNIACPLASSFGDLVTLVILAGCSVSLQKYINTPLPVILLFILLGMIPAWVMYVRRNKFVSEVAKEGWVPVFAAMVIASTAGLTLERYIIDYPGMALMSPVLNGLTGNIGSIYASRISTSLHVNIKENYRATEKTLFLVHIPIQIIFLVVIVVLGLGHIHWSVAVVLGYALVSLSLVVITLAMARWITLMFWRWGYDPDNYALPILTSLIDVIGTAFLVTGFWALAYGEQA